MLHHRTHPTPVDGCYGCKLAAVSLAPSAAGSQQARTLNAREAGWKRDHAAYRRLRANGVQPPRIDGSAHLESQANHRVEVEHGVTNIKDYAKRAERAKGIVE